MKKHLSLFITLVSFICLSAKNPYLEEGKAYGKTCSKNAQDPVNAIQEDDLLPIADKGKVFDASDARKKMKGGNFESSEAEDFLLSQAVQENLVKNKGFEESDLFLKRAEEVTNNPDLYMNQIIEEQEVLESQLEKCFQADAPYELNLIRNLEVTVSSTPEVSEEVQVCKGHYRLINLDKKEIKHLEEKYGNDPEIKEFKICGNALTWKHVDNFPHCWDFHIEKRIINSSNTEESDHWKYADEKQLLLSNSPDCTFMGKSCLDATPQKTINGKQVARKCWKENLSFFCTYPEKDPCAFLKARNCDLIQKNCKEEGPLGCTRWELVYKCPSKIVKKQKKSQPSDWIGQGDESWETEYEPNHSFNDVTTKLAVFSEIKADLEASENSDIKDVSIFSGKKMECSKSIADKALYDCCFKYSGLAKEVGLSKCTADEVSLGEMREQGLCEYIGHYDETFIDLWKSRNVHVFCCYSTKLALAVQKGLHDQLNIDWGSPKKPNCRGLSIDEISKADFNKLDLSLAFEDKEKTLPSNFQQKLEGFQDRFKELANDYEKEGSE